MTMNQMNVRLVIVLLICVSFPCLGWNPSTIGRNTKVVSLQSNLRMSAQDGVENNKNNNDIVNDIVNDDDKSGVLQVTVVGGTGFVGSRVCQILTAQGASVRSISKSGTVPKWCRNDDWSSKVTWSAVDLLNATPSAMDEAMGDQPDAVVSCVGVIGTDPDFLKQGNGDANVAAFESAKRVGAKRAAFISVSSELLACREDFLPEFMGSYFDGKEAAEIAAADAVGPDSLTILKPTFVYGGNSFGINPPRVTSEYGSIIDQLLSLPPIQICADLLPGMVKVALRPPVSVDALAGACAAAAMGTLAPDSDGGPLILDGTKAINAVMKTPPSTGLVDAIVREFNWIMDTSGKVANWMGARLKEQAMSK
jgi:nucleoside-diphosphate-sugar epimerase